MKYLATFTSFIATVSAVDLYYHSRHGCDTTMPWIRCSNFNPDTCCALGADQDRYTQSIAVRGIVEGWHVEQRGYTYPGACRGPASITGNGNNRHICTEGRFYGQGYNFVGKKRAAEPTEVDGGSSECSRPDTLGLPDGTEFDLASLDDEDFNTT